MGNEHEGGHDHSGHAGNDAHGSVGRNPDGSYYYTHGAFLGHIVPGFFFAIWGLWWLVAAFDSYLTALAHSRKFTSRSWYFLFFGPVWLRRIPLEPILKMVLPFFGALGELWLGHESWRRLIAEDGKFVVDNINDWQHSTMYLAFIISGFMDLVGFYSHLPVDGELGFLCLAFLAQGLLLVFHLKGPVIEILVHLILVLQVFATVVAILAEGCHKKNIIFASLRPILTLLQGIWWIQVAFIMFTADPAYDPDYMGGSMMVPAVFVFHLLWVTAAAMILLLVMRSIYSRSHGREISFVSRQPRIDMNGTSGAIDLELSSLTK